MFQIVKTQNWDDSNKSWALYLLLSKKVILFPLFDLKSGVNSLKILSHVDFISLEVEQDVSKQLF